MVSVFRAPAKILRASATSQGSAREKRSLSRQGFSWKRHLIRVLDGRSAPQPAIKNISGSCQTCRLPCHLPIASTCSGMDSLSPSEKVSVISTLPPALTVSGKVKGHDMHGRRAVKATLRCWLNFKCCHRFHRTAIGACAFPPFPHRQHERRQAVAAVLPSLRNREVGCCRASRETAERTSLPPCATIPGLASGPSAAPAQWKPKMRRLAAAGSCCLVTGRKGHG